MESLLPSEVARLVFGYLEDEECAEAAQNFLETSPHLKECLNTSKKGKRFSSKILGLNLVELLDLLSDLVSIVRDHDKYIDWENYDKSRLSVLLKTLNFVETGKHKSSSTIGSIGMVSRPEVNIVPSKDKITSHVQRRSNSNTSMVQNSGTFSFETVDFNGPTLGNDPFEKLCGYIKKGSQMQNREEKELLSFLASAAEHWVQDRIVLLHLKEENDKLSQRLYILESAKKDMILETDEVTYTIADKMEAMPRSRKDILSINKLDEMKEPGLIEAVEKQEMFEAAHKDSMNFPKKELDKSERDNTEMDQGKPENDLRKLDSNGKVKNDSPNDADEKKELPMSNLKFSKHLKKNGDMGWDTKLQILRKTEITSTKENECVPHVRPRCKSGNCHKNPHVVPGPVRSKTRTVFFIRDHDKMTEPCDIRICGAGNETLGYIENQRGVTVPMISNNNTDSSSNEMSTSSLTLESYNTLNIKQEHKIEDSIEECDKNKTISLGMPEHEPPIAINMLPAADVAKSSAGRLETTANKITNPISSQSSLLQHPLNLYQMVGYNQHNVPNVQLTYCVPNVQIACSSQADDAQLNNNFQQGTKCPNGNPVNVTNGEEVWKSPHVRSTVVGRIGKSRVNKNSHKMRTQAPKIESLDMAQHQEHLVSSSSLKFRKIAPKVSQTIANNLQVQMVQSSSSMIDAGEDMEPLVKRSLRSRKRQ